MAIGLIGRKAGMTRIFTEDGVSIPVTVIECEPNRVTQCRTPEKDGYRAIQVTCGNKKVSRLGRPEAGHFAKAGVEAGRGLWEFRLNESESEGMEPGNELGVSIFTAGQFLDVRGRSKGKGFAGTVKRHNFRMQDATHGNSRSHRVPGSTGQNQSPGKVFKGKKMPGQMGNKNRCQQNLELIKVDADRNLLLVKGAVPGFPGGDLIITPAVKKPNKG